MCCDNCLRGRQNDPEVVLTDKESKTLALIDRLHTQIRPTPPGPGASQDVIDVDALTENPKRAGPRRAERLQTVRSAINEWRSSMWSQLYSDCAWGPSTLIPDAIVTKLATRSHILTVEDIKNEIPDWDFADDYGSTILKLIQKTDDCWKEDHAHKIQTKKELRKRRSSENKEHREEERRTKKRMETALRRGERTQINTVPQTSQPSFLPVPSTSSLASSHIFPQPLHVLPQPSHPSHAFPHPMHAFPQPLAHGFPPSQPSVHGFFSQPPVYYGFPQPTAHGFPQPIYFIPGPAYPHTAQVQPHTESCPLSDLTVNQKIQNQP